MTTVSGFAIREMNGYTLQNIRDPHDTDSGNMYACDYDAMVSLKRIADEHDIGVLIFRIGFHTEGPDRNRTRRLTGRRLEAKPLCIKRRKVRAAGDQRHMLSGRRHIGADAASCAARTDDYIL